ncbi:MAG TPA: AbrB/MazE/SpoVT family DNA-binding domain-containing protein [Coriobacteriia bacterium]|nr:AbrB/MazE/SpoVT family DNA-binding domain-containing protein [Coriobacteriia bacterium]
MPKKLVRHGNSRAIVIDKAILELLKIDDETELELTTDGRSLRITPSTDAAARAERLEAISNRIMEQYPDLFRRLAE